MTCALCRRESSDTVRLAAADDASTIVACRECLAAPAIDRTFGDVRVVADRKLITVSSERTNCRVVYMRALVGAPAQEASP